MEKLEESAVKLSPGRKGAEGGKWF